LHSHASSRRLSRATGAAARIRSMSCGGIDVDPHAHGKILSARPDTIAARWKTLAISPSIRRAV
jgi:hypothetical protein